MRINLTGVMVDDQDKALAFYTELLGFQLKRNMPMGEHAWITVVSPENPDGAELLLEPTGHPAAQTYREAMRADGIPMAQFTVDDVGAEFERLQGLGVVFTQPPVEAGPVTMAIFDDTCGNLIVMTSPPPE